MWHQTVSASLHWLKAWRMVTSLLVACESRLDTATISHHLLDCGRLGKLRSIPGAEYISPLFVSRESTLPLMNSPVPLAALAGGVFSLIFYSWYRSKHPVPLPPGPRGNLILGNALEVRPSLQVSLHA